MRNRIIAALAALLVAVGLAATIATPASAAPQPAPTFHTVIKGGGGTVSPDSFSDCLNGQGCAWVDVNGGGERVDIVFSLNGTTCHNLTGDFQDSISSSETLYGSGYGINWYDNANCDKNGPAAWAHQPAFTTKNWTDGCLPPPFLCLNDRISSFKICKDGTSCATNG